MSEKWIGRLGRWGLTFFVLAWISLLIFGDILIFILIPLWPIAGNLPFWQSARRERNPSSYGRDDSN